ncbi:TonB-dependent receptor [Hymenobacter sp. YC55]|uniref:TonB-dependent receptor n=1 Tax=Hymenobacter sp. YC55 TaxID=3034019 RepID=UPI0023F69743|nr:TonB-dependent receptor [Hymenobacter sp. YC55]MDF7812906.1 carboxypeptidase regulatory-like domain-containing protein [Hymenobacter sp. YC55]
MRHLFLLFIGLLFSTLTMAQQGSIVGKVTDKKTGDGVIGATVIVTGTVQAAPVDVEGNYELKLDPGTYNITMTYIGYKPLTFTGIAVTAGNKTTLNGSMEESATSLKEVTVTGQKQTGTEVALIQDLKKSEVVVSGMSNDQIVKSLDRDAAEVVKRIPGVTIQSNNYIVIRGLAERYNTVLLNDALTPSAEVDTRSFSFDILPSSVIDRLLIFKSGSPELPGEMGGGVVKVYTKNSVLENTTSLTVSGWVRSGTTFKNNYLTNDRSSTDWLGFDDGKREQPAQVPDELVKRGITPAAQLTDLSRSFRSTTWLPTITRALPDLRASLGLTRKFDIGSTSLSNVTSLSYSKAREQYHIERNRYLIELDENTQQPRAYYEYDDERALTSLRIGLIHNWQMRLSDRNRLEFRNFFNQYATDEVVHRVGANADQIERDDYSLHYQSRTIYSGQLQGSHDLGENNHTTLTWSGGYNYVFRDEPDYSRYQNSRSTEFEQPFSVNIPREGNITETSRFFSTLKENTYMASGQWERRFTGRDTTRANQFKLRAGFYTEQRERDLRNRYFSFIRGQNFNRGDLIGLPIDQIFAPENLDATTGFTVDEGTKPQDRYNAENTLVAGYVGVVAPISDKFSVSGGIRIEHNRRKLSNQVEDYKEIKTIPMPSFNATYNFNERSLLRLAGSLTVNRPEFREIASFEYYDFTTNSIIIGSPSLKTATIYNGDFRYEFYPSRSELISIGAFYKYFNNAIEQITLNSTGTQLYRTFQNADQAYDVGAELEVRKGLAEVASNSFLQRLSFVANASVIYSRVKLKVTEENEGFALSNRPLQGQSPFVVNLGAFYQDDDAKWQVSAQYNVIGQRFTFIGDKTLNYSVIEMPRHVIDLSVTKGIGQHLQLRAGIQDLLNQSYRQYYDFNRDSKISSNERGSFGTYRRGSYSTLGLTYNF